MTNENPTPLHAGQIRRLTPPENNPHATSSLALITHLHTNTDITVVTIALLQEGHDTSTERDINLPTHATGTPYSLHVLPDTLTTIHTRTPDELTRTRFGPIIGRALPTVFCEHVNDAPDMPTLELHTTTFNMFGYTCGLLRTLPGDRLWNDRANLITVLTDAKAIPVPPSARKPTPAQPDEDGHSPSLESDRLTACSIRIDHPITRT